MKLYLFTRKDNVECDEFDEAVVAATNSQEARKIIYNFDFSRGEFDWKCTLISNTTASKVRKGIVSSSFNS